MNRSKGFTLLELLVVIAIIGILSAVVLASLTTARNKGNDTSVKANLNNIRAQATLYYDTNSLAYGSVGQATTAACPTTGSTMFVVDTNIKSMIARALATSGGLNACGTDIASNPQKYAVATQLKNDLALAWCVDSNGAGKQEGTAGGTALTQTTINAFIVAGVCA